MQMNYKHYLAVSICPIPLRCTATSLALDNPRGDTAY